MVKKIDNSKGSKVTSSSTVAAGKINSVGKVEKTQAAGSISSTRGKTRIMSSAERDQLFALVKDEADKMFESGAIPKDKREQVENAVKMAIDAGILEDD